MTIKLAILGAGEIAEKHLNSLNEIPDFKVNYICDIDLLKANKLARKCTESIAINNIDVILNNKEVDIIDICMPPYLHFSTALKFLESGKHVICEKPISTSVEEAQELVEYSKKSKKNLYPVFQYRYGKNIKTLKYLINKNITGTPIAASSEVHWNRTKEYYDVSWRGTWEGEGGGVILSHAIHLHDLLSFIFGDIKSVSANLATLVNNIETEDSASITMTTESKALISSSITLGAANNTSRLKFIFSNVTAESGDNPYAPGEGKWIFTSRDPVKQNELNEIINLYQKKITPDQDGFRSFFEEIANHLNGNKFNIIEAREGLKSIELAAAIYYSSMSETKVFLPLDRSNLVYKDWRPK